MKELFKGFYQLSEADFAELWDTALFILDASFLCNLYRLPVTTRNEILHALETISDRLWVPNHAALEYQKNRASVIADQSKKFSEVQNVFEDTRKVLFTGLSKLKLKKRHSLIDPDFLEEHLSALLNSFKKKISTLEKEHYDLNNPDPVVEKLGDLLKGCIGDPPEQQKEIDEIYIEGKERYDRKIPPGYMDAKKTKDDDYYQYGGIVYRRTFGDLVVWKQIINHTKSAGAKSAIFLTDDLKEDWYRIIKGKKIGPRPELVDEIYREGGVTQFHIYSSEQFLKFSDQYLEVDISEESIQAAKDVAHVVYEESDPIWTAKNSPEDIINEIVHELAYILADEDIEVTGRIAETNAYAWGLDSYDITYLNYDDSRQVIKFTMLLTLSGEQDSDKMFYGDSIEVDLVGNLKYVGDSFELATYHIRSCEIKGPEH